MSDEWISVRRMYYIGPGRRFVELDLYWNPEKKEWQLIMDDACVFGHDRVYKPMAEMDWCRHINYKLSDYRRHTRIGYQP